MSWAIFDDKWSSIGWGGKVYGGFNWPDRDQKDDNLLSLYFHREPFLGNFSDIQWLRHWWISAGFYSLLQGGSNEGFGMTDAAAAALL